MSDVERYGEFLARLKNSMRAAAALRELLERCRGAMLPPPDDVAGPEAGECVASWGMDCGDRQFTVTARGDCSLAWVDLWPDVAESGVTMNAAAVIDRLAGHFKAKELAGG